MKQAFDMFFGKGGNMTVLKIIILICVITLIIMAIDIAKQIIEYNREMKLLKELEAKNIEEFIKLLEEIKKNETKN